MEQMELQEPKVLQVHKALLVTLVRKAQLALRVLQVLQEQTAMMVQLDYRVQQDLKVLQDHKDHKAQQVQQVQLELQGHRVQLDQAETHLAVVLLLVM
jgi:hypothetical protein